MESAIKTTILEELEKANSTGEIVQLRKTIKNSGYPLFKVLLDDITEKLKQCTDEQLKDTKSLLRKARRVISRPGKISPSWTYIWDESERILQYKKEVLNQVPVNKRDGEWQIIIDNPFTTQGVACHPGLEFLEAAYLFGYLRLDLKRNEYIRLQKIENSIMHQGS